MNKQPGQPSAEGAQTSYLPAHPSAPALPPVGAGPFGAAAAGVRPVKKAEPRVYTRRERLLLPAALAGGVCFERFVFNAPLSSLFWLAMLALFYLLHWERLRGNRLLWYVGGCAALLCLWPLLFDDHFAAFGSVNTLVVPAVVMALTQFSTGGFTLKQPLAIAVEWLLAWVVKPLSAVGHCFGAAASLRDTGRSSALRRVLLGICLSLPLLAVVLPLLAGADRVFAYHMDRVFRHFSPVDFLLRCGLAALVGLLVYSFLWNMDRGKPLQNVRGRSGVLDPAVCIGVLSTLLAIYALFCGMQFAYLFARAGLPEGMTYSEYAREGFWQLIAIAGINLALFGGVLQLSRRSRGLTVLLAALLGMTGILLVSAALRLWLYIDSYLLTWLRLLSAWFILFLAVVLLLCALRLLRHRLPLVAVCSFVLLGWFCVLGFANPDRLVARYNLTHAQDQTAWVENHLYTFRRGSADSYLALVELCEDRELVDEVTRYRLVPVDAPSRPSLSYRRMERHLEAYRLEHLPEDGQE